MKRVPKFLSLGALAAITGGCAGGYVESEGPTPVYGEFGYVEPWAYGLPWYNEGGAYVHPPYHPEDHRDGDHGGNHGPRPPSIPTAPRPGGGGFHGGGGGSHGGGGGGGGSHGGGGGDHKHP